jgi:hypothetical protein
LTLPGQTNGPSALASAVVALACATALCNSGVKGNAAQQAPSNAREHQVKSTSQRPSDMPTETSRPYLQMSDKEKRTLIDNVKKIQLGDKRKQVEALLGKPSEDYPVSRKENNKPIGRLVKYYVLKLDKDLVNEKYDRYVLFQFDNNDSLKKIFSDVPGIENRP